MAVGNKLNYIRKLDGHSYNKIYNKRGKKVLT